MKAQSECFPCLKNLIHQAVNLATKHQKTRLQAQKQALDILNEHFSTNVVPTEISNRFHKLIREITKNPDPYRERKDKEIEVSRTLLKELRERYSDDFRSCVMLSALGNGIDFFRDLNELSEDVKNTPEFAIDDIDDVEKRLRRIRRVVYLADNAGECFFDLPLVNKIKEECDLVYVTKGSPVQNDMTIEDLRKAGILNRFGKITTIGADTVGLDLSVASNEFKKEFEVCDLIVAKGMGYYETLSELPQSGKIFHILKAKCKPVARSLGVPLGSYVAMIR
ncbi:MAG: DUF89 family protein [archaeon]|nr:DUF89 family protein [archaeon]MCP8306553.1 DUF89 family protein [archaeon]